MFFGDNLTTTFLYIRSGLGHSEVFIPIYMKTFIHCLILGLIVLGVLNCQNAPTPIIEEIVPIGAPDSCGVKNVSYNNKIDAIMTKHCKQCHSGNGALKGINLESYQSNKSWFQLDSSRLLGAIRYETGTFMPPKGKIPECEIRQLETWVREGFREN